MSKQRIKVKFVDFHKGLEKNNDFLDILSERYDVEISDNPDFLFYGVFGMEHLNYKDCVRIFFTGECLVPDFNECDYAIGFDRLEFGDRYLRMPLYNMFQYRASYNEVLNRKPMDMEELKVKTDFCSFVCSNGFAQEMRVVFFDLLSKYKKVNSGGRYKNNIGGAVADKLAFQKKHKFCIAFENNSYPGYCTEKLMEGFASRSIPIYYGDPTVCQDFNPASFINVHDYANLDEVVRRVQEIDNNDELYLSIINAPIVEQRKDIRELADFLFHIVEQGKGNAMRRPMSRNQNNKEAMQLRHRFFEEKVYMKYRRFKSMMIQLKQGTIISKKRTK